MSIPISFFLYLFTYLFLYCFIFTTFFLFVLFKFKNITGISSKIYMDTCQYIFFYLVEIYGLIGKTCSFLHCKAYFYRLVHDFVVCFLVIYYL